MRTFTPPSSSVSRIRVFRAVLLSSLLLLAGLSQAQEGTKQVMPSNSSSTIPDNGTGLLISKDIGQGSFLNAISDINYKENVIHFNIQNTSEIFYFGVKAYNRPFNPATTAATVRTDVWYRIYDPSGVEVQRGKFIPGTNASRSAGWINDYEEAYNGPDINNNDQTKYLPLNYTPTTTGNFSIVLYPSDPTIDPDNDGIFDEGDNEYTSPVSSGNPASAPTVMTFFDFSVADGTALKQGRVYCQKWSFIAYHPDTKTETANLKNNQGSELVSSVGAYYALTTDNVINKIQFQDGFRPLSFVLAFNDYGVRSNFTNFDSSAKSQNTGTQAPTLTNSYKVFLNRPDNSLVGSFSLPPLPTIGTKIYGCPGSYEIPYTIDEAGDVSFFLDFNKDGVEDPEDLILHDYNKPAGQNYIHWDGKDKLGNDKSGVSITIKVTFAAVRGRTNIPLYDVELNTAGFLVTPITWNLKSNPLWTETDPSIHTVSYYWNDSDLKKFNPNNVACDQTADAATILLSNDIANTNGTVGGKNYSNKAQTDGHSWNGGLAAGDSPGTNTQTLSCDDYGNVRTINTWFWGYEVNNTETVTLTFQGCPPTPPAGTANDIDDDDDGIPDIVENSIDGMTISTSIDPFLDEDGDGLLNYADPYPGPLAVAAGFTWVDSNDDKINDHWDNDLDGVVNELDRDSDNDGIPDIVEAGGIDEDGDGKIDVDANGDGVLEATIAPGGVIAVIDTDGDGLIDSYDKETFGHVIPIAFKEGIKLYDTKAATNSTKVLFDFDGDGVPNYLDLDSDNDGIPDVIEQGGLDANRDGIRDGYTDADGDGYNDAVDSRSGTNVLANFGTPIIKTLRFGIMQFAFEQGGDFGSAPMYYKKEDGTTNVSLLANADQDYLPNMWDLDADGDGITDRRESGIDTASTTGIGVGLRRHGWLVADSAYLSTNALRNTDGTGRADYLDIDADDDGITDNIEGQTTAGYITPSGVDADFDGIDDSYDDTPVAFGGKGIRPTNRDKIINNNPDDLPDYIDTDSDGDATGTVTINSGIVSGGKKYDKDEAAADPNDAVSTSVNTNNDTDEDGLMNQFDNFDLQYYKNDYFWISLTLAQLEANQQQIPGWNEIDGNESNAPSEIINLHFPANVTSERMATSGDITGGKTFTDAASLAVRMGTTVNVPRQDNITVDAGTERDWRYVAAIALPVTLIEFKGNSTTNGNKLRWKTATEDNASHFVIERSFDGFGFTSIGQLSSRGNNSIYEFVDAQPKAINYYRLKIVDVNGNYKHSNTILLHNNGSSIVLNAVRPNPFISKLTISITLDKAQPLTVTLSDNYGRIVKTQAINGIKGLNDLTLTGLDGLASGLYVIRINDGGTIIEQKIIKN